MRKVTYVAKAHAYKNRPQPSNSWNVGFFYGLGILKEDPLHSNKTFSPEPVTICSNDNFASRKRGIDHIFFIQNDGHEEFSPLFTFAVEAKEKDVTRSKACVGTANERTKG